ncbi:MAG: hypothetical protein JNK07_14770 [Alphaproteobacteria bacterium]|nr:hypothetical protein [Alphaproteobacteria bacterium]
MKHVFIVGTPFSGSTYLTAILNGHPDVLAIGELERLPRFRRYEHLVASEPEIYDDGCLLCRTLSRPCPLWNAETLAEIDTLANVFEIHRAVARRAERAFGRPVRVTIDSSKTPDWLRYAARTVSGIDGGFRTVKDEDVCAIITTKSVFGYAESMMRRSGMLPILAAQSWCDVTTDALRVISSLSIPSMIVRYENLRMGPEMMIKRLCRFLGLSDSDEIVREMCALTAGDHHGIGGNTFAYRDMLGDVSKINLQNSWEGLRADYRDGPPAPRRWIDKLDRDAVMMIASARGVHDLSQELGYDLGLEMEFHRDARR